ncbi:hypothetical protein M378DRAFT_24252 [Amanita muscaria Koide BX008]|uniref:Uncharacterized protein n=1 Tax=Amanita muscaria (strain Koide BX008) TaxID=946122 RepID=A0A0C2X888_AMAMK|nr:hypothetical protein M378DRAFT_24252 [Amanita muscaria Koide BX008]
MPSFAGGCLHLLQSARSFRLLDAPAKSTMFRKSVAQNALGVSPEYCSSYAWSKIEDGMVIALARAGQICVAHAHWERILANGGTQRRHTATVAWNVVPNQHIYKISKLSRARMVAPTIDLFYQMKLQHINLSFITYGAIIGACARWVMSRVQRRFAEMEASRDLKQHVPPYNMMQLYAMTKHNRERAVYYHEKEDERKPDCAYYKLLWMCMAHWNLDINSTEQEFLSLQRDIHVPILGTDFFSYQCIRCIVKDLTKLPSNFDSLSIPITPTPNLVMRWYTRL